MALGINKLPSIKTKQSIQHFVEPFLNLIEYVSQESFHDQATQNSRPGHRFGGRHGSGQHQLCGQAQRSSARCSTCSACS
jgi:hypothetical protein